MLPVWTLRLGKMEAYHWLLTVLNVTKYAFLAGVNFSVLFKFKTYSGCLNVLDLRYTLSF